MLVAILGDVHFGARGDSPHFHQYFRKFYEQVFFPVLESANVKYVIQLGDVFDRRKFINYNTLQQSREYFFEPLNRDYKSWLLVGNHDTYFKNTNEVNSLQLLLKEYSNIHGVIEPYETSLDGLSILMVPWICQENYNRVIDAIRLSRSPMVAGHFEITGFEMHRGALCDDGMNPEDFGKFDQVISGHFHTRSRHSNITYVGTPYEMTWSDYEDTKGFHLLDTHTRELTFIRNPYSMFHKLWYDDSQASMSDILDQDMEPYKDTIVKVIIKNKINPVWFDMYVEKIERVGVVDLQVVEDHLNLNLEDDTDIVNEAEDTLTILKNYVNQLEIKADKGKLDNLLRTLYHQALSME